MSTFIGIVVGVAVVALALYLVYRKYAPQITALEASARQELAGIESKF